MEADMTLSIEYENKIAEQAAELLKVAIKNGNYDKKYGYRQKVSDAFCDELDTRNERDGFTIELSSFCSGVFCADHICHIMKNVLTELATALPAEPFTCSMETTGEQDYSKIEAKYDGQELIYDYQFEELGWNDLYCEECDYEGEIEEFNEDGEYICPNCGAEIMHYASRPDVGHYIIKIQ